jgi:hypothetical protein
MAIAYWRRQALGLTAAALGAGLLSACQPASSGNRIIITPTETPADERLKPRVWKTTRVNVGAGAASVATLNLIQQLQLPDAKIPYLTSMTFFAPKEVPFVTIGLYYERNALSAPARQILTSSAFALQQISDLDAPLRYAPGQVETVQTTGVTGEALSWFAANRQQIVDAMKASAQGVALSRLYDCDFTSKPRPPDNTPAALVIAGGNYSGTQVPDTVIAQQVVFAA